MLALTCVPALAGAQGVPQPDGQRPAPTFQGPRTIASILAPERRGGIAEVEIFLAPAHVRQESRGYLLIETGLTYRARRPLYVRARMGPLAAPLGERSRFAMGRLTFGLDHRFFELGAGVGAARMTDAGTFPCTREDPAACTTEDLQGPAFTLALETRIGARDGLSLSLSYVHVVAPYLSAIGQLDWTVQIPLAEVVALQMRMSILDLSLGYSQVGFGIRARVHGRDPGRGSLFVTPGFAFLAVPGDANSENVSLLLGLAATLGIEYRP